MHLAVPGASAFLKRTVSQNLDENKPRVSPNISVTVFRNLLDIIYTRLTGLFLILWLLAVPRSTIGAPQLTGLDSFFFSFT